MDVGPGHPLAVCCLRKQDPGNSLDPALHALYGEGDQKKRLFVCVVVVVHACTVGYNMYIRTLLQKNAMHH